jgi:hypothetical protein
MAIEYERDDARRRIRVTPRGRFVLAEAIEAVDRQWRENVWHYGVLNDLSAVSGACASTEMQQLGEHLQQIAAGRPRGPIAIVTNDPAVFGMCRMYSTLTSGVIDVNVFDTVEAATAWLDQQESSP